MLLLCLYFYLCMVYHYCIMDVNIKAMQALLLQSQDTVPTLDVRKVVRDDICVSQCKLEHSVDQGHFIRCCLCTKWYHLECME